MNKLSYGSLSCTLSAAPGFSFRTQVPCTYQVDTIRYAALRFVSQSASLRRECTWKSWQLRLSGGKGRKQHRFRYLAPAVLAELPGQWVQITGSIDRDGVTLRRVVILASYPNLPRTA